MADENDRKDTNYPLYTEKIVMSPKRKYKRLIKAVRICGICLFIIAACGMVFIYLLPLVRKYICERKEPEDKIVIEKDEYLTENPDEYDDYEDYEDPITEADMKQDYEAAMAALRAKIESVQNCIVLIDSQTNSDFSEMLNKSEETSGLVVGHVNSRYIILTSKQFTDAYSSPVIRFSDSSEITANLLCSDEDTGISLISIPEIEMSPTAKSEIKVCVLDNSYRLKKGDMVIAAGKIYDANIAVDYGTITSISSMVGIDNCYETFDTNLSYHPDDYAFLFNSSGNVVGISIMSEENVMLKVMGISDLKSIIEDMTNHQGTIYFGIQGQSVTTELAEKYELPTGVYISEVETGSPAYVSGLQAGDVITYIDDKQILTIQMFSEKLYQCTEGQIVTVTVKRRGKDEYSDLMFEVQLEKGNR